MTSPDETITPERLADRGDAEEAFAYAAIYDASGNAIFTGRDFRAGAAPAILPLPRVERCRFCGDQLPEATIPVGSCSEWASWFARSNGNWLSARASECLELLVHYCSLTVAFREGRGSLPDVGSLNPADGTSGEDRRGREIPERDETGTILRYPDGRHIGVQLPPGIDEEDIDDGNGDGEILGIADGSEFE